MSDEQTEYQGPVIRDKRRFDPQTGALREPQATAAPGSGSDAAAGAADVAVESIGDGAGNGDDAGAAGHSDAEGVLAERTADLQRLQAEYVNYKRRVDRDREVARDAAKVSVLTGLLPVLDDIGRAREHDELTGGFKAVAESLERTVASLGLVPFGEVGDEFDPHRHEALMHSYSDEVSGPVCEVILQVGYLFGDRVVRPARVAVAEPAEAVSTEPSEATHAEPTAEAGDPTDGEHVTDGEPVSDGAPVSESSAAAGRGAQMS